MNYFEFYEIPMTFEIDAAALKRIFYANSKKYHPDFYTMESDEKQAEILELSTLNNEAYKVLSNADKRMRYILEQKEVLEAEGQNKIPQDFLMEMMDINEALMELEFGFDEPLYQKIEADLTELEKSLEKKINPILTEFADNQTIDLNPVKVFYLKKRYLLRIRKNLDKFVPT